MTEDTSLGPPIRQATDRVPFHLALAALVAASFAHLPEIAEARGIPTYSSVLTALLMFFAGGAWVLQAARTAAKANVSVTRGLFSAFNDAFAHPMIPLLGYALVVIAGMVYAQDAGRSVDEIKNLALSVILMTTIILIVTSMRALLIAGWAMVGAALFISLVNLAQHFTGRFDQDFFGVAQSVRDPISDEPLFQIGGPFGDPNYLSQRLVVATAFAFCISRVSPSRVHRSIAALSAAVCAGTVIVSGSRGGLIALLVVGFMLIRSTVRPERRGQLAVAILLAGSLTLIPVQFRERVMRIPESAASLFSSDGETGRAREWTVAVAMYGDHPLLGVGSGNFPTHYLEYASDTGADLRPQERSPHTLLLEILTENGLLGFIAFASVLVMAFDALTRARRRSTDQTSISMVEALRVALMGYLIAGLFLGLSYPKPLWILLGLAYACTQIEATKADPEVSTTTQAVSA